MDLFGAKTHAIDCDLGEDCRGCDEFELRRGDALDLLSADDGRWDLIVTDPPYAFGGTGPEHALSATVAVVLREAARRLKVGGWMVVLCASSWRSQAYMVEAVRGLLDPVRTGTWVKPSAKSKVRAAGWNWASVSAVAMRRGKSAKLDAVEDLDWIEAAPVTNGRRAELPTAVAQWACRPFIVRGGRMLDPFAGSGALPRAASRLGMKAVGFEKQEA